MNDWPRTPWKDMKRIEAEVRAERAEERLDDLARRLGVPDGGRYLNDWYSRIDRLLALERGPEPKVEATKP